MIAKPTLSELVKRWERSPVSPEELCRECPELLSELRGYISQLANKDQLSESSSLSTVDPETPLTKPKAPENPSSSQESKAGDKPGPVGESDKQGPRLSKIPTVSHVFNPADESGQSTSPRFVDRYRLDEKIGRGGFGEVWKGFDAELNRVVAVKVPRPDRMHSTAHVESFLAEARKAASLRHEHIVRVYDVRSQDKSYFIISEYIAGSNLRAAMRAKDLTIREKVKIIADVADALHYAHGQGIIHRDVKPANILMTESGKPCLTDFGLAVTEEEQLHESAGVCGTPKYMSPEQARGEGRRADPRTDVYSLGVVFYEMLSNRAPYKANSSEEYLQQIIHKEPWPLRSLDESIPHELERICLKCLAKSPSNRYTTAGDLADELQKWLRDSAESAPAAPVKPAAARWVIAGLVLAAVLLIAIYAVFRNPTPVLVDESQAKKLQPVYPAKKDNLFPKKDDPLAWVAKLNVAPKEMIWPGYSGTGSWYLDKKNGALVIASNRLRMVQLGEILPDVDSTISMEIQQPEWQGSAGVFLGYDEVPDKGGRPRAAFQSLRLIRSRDKKNNHVMQMRRRYLFASPFSGSLLGGLESVQDLGLPEGETKFRLKIVIAGNQLRSATWGTVKLNNLTNGEANRHFQSKDYIGAWGVYSTVGMTFFINPKQTAHIKDKKDG